MSWPTRGSSLFGILISRIAKIAVAQYAGIKSRHLGNIEIRLTLQG
jgi:hypothetical protein